MKPNVHVHLFASDLAKSAAFYEALFGAPVKVKAGYRKFLPAFAPLNLALSERAIGEPSIPVVSHLGVQFETPENVREHLTRIKSAGLPVKEEMGVSCCHANQDKFWVRDPDGVEWEFYNVNFDIESEVPSSATAVGCCTNVPAGKGVCGA
jgi:catechol 2,3-dioxygenase-like lactoylglutathione lyase family enzyme